MLEEKLLGFFVVAFIHGYRYIARGNTLLKPRFYFIRYIMFFQKDNELIELGFFLEGPKMLQISLHKEKYDTA